MNGVQILIVVGVGIAVSALARRRGVEPGVIIVALAAAASFIPGTPRLELDSELILAIVVPPLLYSATRAASFASFGANLRAIWALGVVLVVLTTGALGLLSSWLLPSLGLSVAFVLGAVLAPPDTITTVSHGDAIGLPKRVTSILTGESLVNDATALTLFSIAVAAVNGRQATWSGGVIEFARNAMVGIVIGGLLAAVALFVRKRLQNPTLETTLVLLVPFTAFLAAEEARASGILAVVMAAFALSGNLTLDPRHQYPGAYRTRVQEEEFWPVLDFLLETFVFAYIGLQLRFVLEDLADSSEPGLARTLVAAGVLLFAAVGLRLAGVQFLFGRWLLKERGHQRRVATDARYRARYQAWRERRRRRAGDPLPAPTSKETLLVGWTGMRGILTLAAAAAIPEHTESGAEFPGRDAIQAIALIVTLGTLLLQGTTIGWLARSLKFDLSAERAETEALREKARTIVAGAEPAAETQPAGSPTIDARPGAVTEPDAAPSADDRFEAQRLALGRAVRDRVLPEEIARELIKDVDLRQAAHHTASPTGPVQGSVPGTTTTDRRNAGPGKNEPAVSHVRHSSSRT